MIDLPPQAATQVPANTPVYKDECMFTFDTPESNAEGLDVDVITYRGYARTSQNNFTGDNYARTGNRYYLNIRKQRKPEAPSALVGAGGDGEKPAKLQKLAVKDIADEDVWDYLYRVYDAETDQYFPLSDLSEPFQRLVASIIEAKSSTRQDEISTWEHEIGVCPHSIDIVQHPIEPLPSLKHCGQCDLTQNLWICLECGTLGCGRQQFGSDLPGNSHALAHYETTKHPVAVKLGSLSASGGYDAYCYQCNDEVKVPRIGEWLATFGINLADTNATEKSLVELNIEQNLKWDFSLDGADGAKYPPVFGKDFTGMANLGNSCYLNSVVQLLYSTEHYRQFFSKLEFDTMVSDPAHDLPTQLYKLYDGLWNGRFSVPVPPENYQAGIKPHQFKQLIGANHPEFQTMKQQDAYEFLTYLVDTVDKQWGLELNRPLKFLWGQKVVCTACRHGRITEELVDTVMVPIVKGENRGLVDGFTELSTPETIEGFHCDHCKQSTTAITAKGFVTFPDYLVVAAQRIALENWVPVKVETPIAVPYTLDVTNFAAPAMAEDEVELAPVASGAKDDSVPEFLPSADALSMLTAMGFPEPRCIKGLYHTGNADAEAAMNWILAHMDDPDIDQPLDLSKNASSGSGGPQVDAELVATVSSMGFSQQLATKALYLNGNDANAAVEWLFAHPDDDGVIDEGKPQRDVAAECRELRLALQGQDPGAGQYRVKAVVCHKGTSPHTGHYVVFIRQIVDGTEKWVLYNDEKVVEITDDTVAVGDPEDIRNNGYIYLFEKVK
ncbi:hypothetical protein DIURU_005759 [Diutina rugosa]|uniref:Ubiquitin carboxyl-terminal hydrolase n=1 Tax=Diutina rugosa TaxID=5481 RepID=A0A642UC01_DIURU|nr:uncharacterized protein DIURU_005759 [Diutina rugosa]KAA8896493.1 hypothetical protein DIURU_005759 [Diutina rugosa]